jgi:hypothetical protein
VLIELSIECGRQTVSVKPFQPDPLIAERIPGVMAKDIENVRQAHQNGARQIGYRGKRINA